MGIQYRITYDKRFYKDLHVIELRTTNNYYKKVKNKINIMIENLQYMPRAHKTLIYFNDKNGEYRRIVSGKYSNIYKIANKEVKS